MPLPANSFRAVCLLYGHPALAEWEGALRISVGKCIEFSARVGELTARRSVGVGHGQEPCCATAVSARERRARKKVRRGRDNNADDGDPERVGG